jgi:hypothetical protein
MCLPGYEQLVSSSFRTLLRDGTWDELALFGMECQNGTGFLWDSALGLQSFERPSWYVDLASLRCQNRRYETLLLLSSKTRQQIRRSIRIFEETCGPVKIAEATTTTEALDHLALLSNLHQSAWLNRGKRGAFASQKFVAFHRGLVSYGFEKGLVHLLRATAGEQVFGVLYNFFFRGRVYYYRLIVNDQTDDPAFTLISLLRSLPGYAVQLSILPQDPEIQSTPAFLPELIILPQDPEIQSTPAFLPELIILIFATRIIFEPRDCL